MRSVTIVSLLLTASLAMSQTVVHPGGKKGSYASYTPLSICRSDDHQPGDYGFKGDQSRLMQTRELWIHERENQPIPTNDWWTNLITQPYSGRLWSYPQFVQAQSYGVDVQMPSRWIEDGTEMKSNTVLSVKADRFRPAAAVAEHWHDWDVAFSMRDGDRLMYTTMAHGMPFTWIEMRGIDPIVNIGRSYQADPAFTANDARVLDTDGNLLDATTLTTDCVVLALGDDRYAIYLPAATSVRIDGPQISLKFAGDRGFVVVGVLPADGSATAASMKQYAYNVPRSTRVDHVYADGKLKTTWHVDAVDLRELPALPEIDDPATGPDMADEPLHRAPARAGNTTDILQGFLPHHYRDTGNEPGFSFGAATYATPHGRLKMAAGNDFEITYDFCGMLPYYAVPEAGNGDAHPYSAGRMREMLEAYTVKGSFGDDTYWGGKGLTQMALYMMFAREMGETGLFDTCRRRLKEALINWLTWTPGETRKFFARYDRWGAMVGYATSYDSETFNDHHFHYGYFTYAAALLALVDDDFRDNYGDMLTLIAKDYANWDREATDYPFFRTFDPWAGHSFAGGMGDDNGNGQESTSEAMQGWGGLYLLGVALGNDAMRDAGIFGWVSEARGTAEYWFDRHKDPATGAQDYHTRALPDYNINYDLFTKDGRPLPYNSNLTCHGVGFWTYFGYDAIFMQGIQWMPVSPALDYLSEDKAFAAWDWNRMWTDKAIGGWFAADKTDAGYLGDSGGWGNVALSYMQRSDPSGAAEIFDRCWEAGEPEFKTYDTNGITYFVTHSHLTYGDIDWTVHASVPTARVYVKDGEKTYMSFNPGDEAIDVVFSDGYTLAGVAPRRLKVSGRTSLDNTSITTSADVVSDPRDEIEMLNLAFGKTAESSGNENEGFAPSNAIDGNAATRWASLKEDNQWITVDLGKPALIYKMAIHWETACPHAYKVLFSDDNTTWTEAVDMPVCAGGRELLDTGDRPARYIKIACGRRKADNWGVSVFEIEVFGRYADAQPGDLLGLKLSPGVDVLKQHQPSKINALGLTCSLEWVPVSPQWSCDASQGTVTSDGIFTPAIYPEATVRADVGGVTVAKAINVEEAFYARYLTISPATALMADGDDLELRLDVLDQFKGRLNYNPGNLVWRVVDAEENDTDGLTLDAAAMTAHANAQGEYKIMVTNIVAGVSDTVDVRVCRRDEINLALGEDAGGRALASATSSGGSQSNNSARLAIDGDPTTRWEAPAGEISNETDVTWTVDLGSVRDFNTIMILWEAACSADFDIAVSNDDITYVTVKHVAGYNPAGEMTQALEVGGQHARYIRFVNRRRATAYGVSFYEFAVYNLSEPLRLVSLAMTGDYSLTPAGGQINLTVAGFNQLGTSHPVGEVGYEIEAAGVARDADVDLGHVDGHVFTAGTPGEIVLTAVTPAGVRSNPMTVTVFEGEKINVEPENVSVMDGTYTDGIANAFDDEAGSIWVLHDDPGTRDYETGFVVDFGKTYYLTALSIAFEGACSQNYTVDFSTDGVNFSTPFEYKGEIGVRELRERRLHSTPAVRYARFISTRAATPYGVKLRDFSLYGQQSAPTAIVDVGDDVSRSLCAPFTVHTLDGRLILDGASSLPPLQPGCYIINGQIINRY